MQAAFGTVRLGVWGKRRLPVGRAPYVVFPVEERCALVWEEVEEDQETARRMREDPEGWHPPSVDYAFNGPPPWAAESDAQSTL